MMRPGLLALLSFVFADARADLSLMRDYLTFLRQALKKPVEELVPFDEAYRAIDWSRFARIPAFDAANRGNAYNTYLLLEKRIAATLIHP